MSSENGTATTKLAVERSSTNGKLSGDRTDKDERGRESTVAASSTAEDATTTDGTPTAGGQVGSWTGWAELENDPVSLCMSFSPDI